MSDDVNARIEQLEAEVRELRAQVAQDRAEPGPSRRLSRRALLGGAAAAGAGIAGTALTALPAGAIDPNDITKGVANDAGGANTSLTSTNLTTLTLTNGTADNVPLGLTASTIVGPPGAGAHVRGDLFVGSTGRIFLCITSGTPGTWRPLAQVGATNSEAAGNTTIFQSSVNPAVEATAAGTANVAPLRVAPSLAVGPPTGAHFRGEIYIDGAGKLFFCMVDGNPGHWRTLAVVGADNSDSFGNPTVFTNGSTAAIQVSAGGNADVPPLFIAPSINAGAPANGTHSIGEIHVDSAGTIFNCIIAGTPGTWVRQTPLVLLPAPVRIYDSRAGQAPLAVGPKTPLAVNENRLIDATLNSSGVPVTASAVLVNLTVTGTVGSGFLGLFKDGISYPNNSNINWFGNNQNIANAATTAVANSAKFRVHCGGNPTNVIFDVIGYYT